MPSREENEAIAGLLRRSLSDEGPRDGCLDPELLAAYFDHSLAASEGERCEVHLSRCPRCRQGLTALARAGESGVAPAPQRESAGPWLLDWRWLTAAAAVVALATLWAIGRPEAITKVATPANAPLVAMTRQTQEATSPAKVEPEKPANMITRDRLSRARSAPPRKEPPPGLANEGAAESFAPQVAQSRAQPPANVPMAKFLPEAPAGSGGGIGAGSGAVAGSPAERKMESPRATRAGESQTDEQLSATPQTVLEGPGTKQIETLATPNQPNPSAARQAVGRASGYRAIEATSDGQALEQRTSETVIDTPNPSVKWRISKPGFVERTEDGGATWFGEEVEENGSLLAASAPDQRTCWVVGRQGAVYVTKDARTWRKTTAPTDADLIAVAARNGSSAIVTAADGRRFSTRDGGKKWKPLGSSPDSNHP
jgi:Putative zinc-finger